MRASGATWAEVGRAFGISDRQARRAAGEAHEIEAELVEGADTEGTLRLVAEVQLRALNRLDDLLVGEPDNDSAIVGAARAAGTVGAAVIDTWRAAGALPDPATFKVASEVGSIIDALLRVAREEGIDPRAVMTRLEDEPSIRNLGLAAAA